MLDIRLPRRRPAHHIHLMKTLHPACRVTELAASLGFYSALGYDQVGRVDMGVPIALQHLSGR